MPDATGTQGSTITINNNTSTTTNWSGSGGTPGQGNVGAGGRDGNGNGDGDGDGEVDGPGTPGSGVVAGDLVGVYGENPTVGALYGAFKMRVEGAPIVSAVDGFFSAPSGGGSCPVWSWSSEWTGPLVFDFFCSGVLAGVLALAGWIVMAVAAYKAFHIAIGD